MAVAVGEDVGNGVKVGKMAVVVVGDDVGMGTAVGVAVSIKATDKGTAVGNTGDAVQAVPHKSNKRKTRCRRHMTPLSKVRAKDASSY